MVGGCLFDTSAAYLVPPLKQSVEVTCVTSSSDVLESCARDRTICLGDYHDDLAGGLLSPEEQEELDEAENNGRRMSLYSLCSLCYKHLLFDRFKLFCKMRRY